MEKGDSLSFVPVSRVWPDDFDELAYEPAANLAEALKLFERANKDCRFTPTFSNLADACRKCRTAFAEFIGEAITAGPSVRKTLLPRLQGLLLECREVVTEARLSLADEQERALAQGYLNHIEDRIRLADALHRNALPGYMEEIAKELLRADTPAPTPA